MGMLKEFREFAVKGNVVDMAVGIIIGASFGKIVSSLVADVIMPPIGMVVGGINFTGFKAVLKDAVENQPAVTLNYGTFLQTVFDFMIVAFAMFLLIKTMNKMKKSDAPPPGPSAQEILLGEIRDILKGKAGK